MHISKLEHRKLFRRASLMILYGAVIFVSVLFLQAQLGNSLRSETVKALDPGKLPSVLALGKQQTSRIFTSEVIKTKFSFNAIAPYWKESLVSESNRTAEVRVSSDGKEWSGWLEVEAGKPLKDAAPVADKVFPETPLFVEGHYFQYRFHLDRDTAAQPSPRISDVTVNYIDSRMSGLQRTLKTAGKIFDGILPSASAASQGPEVISRAAWGSPDPYGTKFRDTNRYWKPSYKPVKQVFLHHTVTPSKESDPAATVRAIWDYHANTLGWGDIGYNYLVDGSGRIYAGRSGGDNVVAGHVLSYNSGSLGVAVLGCFESGSTCNEVNGGSTKAPSNTVIDKLATLLSWKATNLEINPKVKQTFCNNQGSGCLNLWTISAHRDAGGTSCNGDLFYEKLATIRDQVANKNTNSPWAYSAKQLSYGTVNLNDDTKVANVTLSFKNTGTATWSNSTNRILLKTTNPTGRSSDFVGAGWINSQTPAVLSEASVAPDGTGTFTFQMKRPSGKRGDFFEGVRLLSENNTTIKQFFNLRVNAGLSHPDGTLIQASGDNRIFLVDDNKRRHIKSRQIFASHGFKWEDIIDMTRQDTSLSIGSSLGFREGALVQGSNNPVYIVDYDEAGQIFKRHITTRAALDDLGFTYSEVMSVKDADLPVANGTSIDNSSLHPDGTLVRLAGDPKVYLIESGQKRHILNKPVLESNGFKFNHVKDATVGDLNLTDKEPVNLREGTLIQAGTDPVYLVGYSDLGAEKRHIVSRGIFNFLNYKSVNVRDVKGSELPSSNGTPID